MTLLPEGLDWLQFGLLSATSFLTSMVSAALGLGGGVALLALMATMLPTAALIPVHGLVQLGSNVGRAILMFRHVDRGTLWPFVAGTAAGALLGGGLAMELPGDWVKIGIGLFILWSVSFKPPAFFRRAAALTGAVSSFLSMFFGATGPFVASYVKALDLNRQGVVSTHATFMTFQHLLKVLAFGLFGFAFGPWLGLIGAMLLAGFAGTWVGEKVLNRLPEKVFRYALTAILVVAGLQLIYEGVLDLLH
jgi:uncharacterized membrane protein YfcA